MRNLQLPKENTVAAWALFILGVGLELLAAAIWQEAGLGQHIAHGIVSFFIK